MSKKISLELIKGLRESTGAGIMDVKAALAEAGGNEKKAKEVLKKKGIKRAAKRSGREAKEGKIISYIHQNGRVGVMLQLHSESDFVARNEKFENLGAELCMQVASMNAKDVKELLGQEYIRDDKKKISDLISEAILALGEKIEVGRS